MCCPWVQVPLSVPSGPPTPVHYNSTTSEAIPHTEASPDTSITQPIPQAPADTSVTVLGGSPAGTALSSFSPQPTITPQQVGTTQVSETGPSLNEPALTTSPLSYGASPHVSTAPEPTATASPLTYGAVPFVVPTNQMPVVGMASPAQSGLMIPAPVKIELPSMLSTNVAMSPQQPSLVVPGGSPPSVGLPSVSISPQVPISAGGVMPPGSAALERT